MESKEEIEYRLRELKAWIEKEREAIWDIYEQFGEILGYLEEIIGFLEEKRS